MKAWPYWWWQQTVVRQDGLYRPPAWALEAVLFLVALAVVVVMWLLGKTPGSVALFQALLPCALAAARGVTWRRHGPLGAPLVRLEDGQLRLQRTLDGRDAVQPIGGVRKLVVYGLRGRRKFRFVHAGGGHTEVMPAWRRPDEAAAIAFLQQTLPFPVVVEPAQTLFADARGDGPAEDD
jgi:hypothetical protein